MSNTVRDRLEKANTLNKGRDYSAAIALYEEILQEDETLLSGWDARSYTNSLRKSGKPAAAIAFARSCLERYPSYQPLLNELAWALFVQDLKEPFENEPKVLAAAQEILDICKPDDQFAPTKLTIFKIMKYYAKLTTPRYDKVLEWLERLDEKQLSDAENQIPAPDGSITTVASEVEKYFAAKTESLLQLGRYPECLQYIELAMQRISKFHNNQDVWMERRKAKCLFKTGRCQEAETILTKILVRKKDWFIYKELADIFVEKGDYDAALKYAIEGALAFGDQDMKIHLYELLAELLRKRGDEAGAKKHLEMVASIRIDKGWPISAALQQTLESYEINMHELAPKNALRKALEPRWEELKFVGLPLSYGRIKTILPNGKNGFITADSGKDYFFRLASFGGPSRLARPNAQVSFYLEEGFDAKKGCAANNAVNVKLWQVTK